MLSLSSTRLQIAKTRWTWATPKQKSRHLALGLWQLPLLCDCGNRHKGSQTLGVDGNLEVSGPGLSQCCQSIEMPIEHLLSARPILMCPCKGRTKVPNRTLWLTLWRKAVRQTRSWDKYREVAHIHVWTVSQSGGIRKGFLGEVGFLFVLLCFCFCFCFK